MVFFFKAAYGNDQYELMGLLMRFLHAFVFPHQDLPIIQRISICGETLGSPRGDRHATICARPAYAPFAQKVYHPEPLIRQIPRLDSNGYDLLLKFLQYEGRDRISAQDAMRHNFLRTLPPKVGFTSFDFYVLSQSLTNFLGFFADFKRPNLTLATFHCKKKNVGLNAYDVDQRANKP
ncbi:unnamed protein product [Strongylus vulgaris]|uniref:Protein kinase domain-containing protein n=1 Tax=Strongylus vulgaris TaxID=40348 RepID=A0A3P7LYS7_STRVU|nr:unnamed protein product [Strongylus vulgaris]